MYAKIVAGQVAAYPYSRAQLVADHPNVSPPAALENTYLEDAAIVVVEPSAKPSVSVVETCTESTPTLVDGVWTQTFDIDVLPVETAEAMFDEAKARKRNAVNALRDAREEDVGSTPFGVVDTDPRSAKRLNAVLGLGLTCLVTGQPWTTINWTLADNSEAVIDTPVKALQLALGPILHANQLHIYAKDVKADLDAVVFDPQDPVAAIAALDAVDITVGWP